MAKQTFTTGQVLSAAQVNALQANDYNTTVSTKTASYVLVAADVGTTIVQNVATANSVTVNTGLFAAGDTLRIQNIGAGIATVTAGTATVNTANSLALPQWGSGILYFTSTSAAIFFPSAAAAGAAFSGCKVTFSAAFSVPNTTHTLLTWDIETYDVGAYHHPTVNTGRLTVTNAGYYLISVFISWQGNATGVRQVTLRKNNGDLQYNVQGASTTGNTASVLVIPILAAANDYFEIYCYQDSGGTRTLDNGTTQAFFSIVSLGA